MAALTLMGLLWIGVTVVTAVYFITEPASVQKMTQMTKSAGSGSKKPLPANMKSPGGGYEKRKRGSLRDHGPAEKAP